MFDPLVYYPGFEPENTHWLKFALLYLDEVSPIIPESGDSHLSEDFRYLKDHTDLLNPLRPEMPEGNNATLDAIDQIEKILANPTRYKHIFNMENVVAEWTNPDTHEVELFNEKFSDTWEHFCRSHGLGTPTSHGIEVSRSLSNIYMTILAHAISDHRGLSPITDLSPLDEYTTFLRQAHANSPHQLKMARGVIELSLPKKLYDLDIETVVRFRNRTDIHEKRVNLNLAMNGYLSSCEKGQNPKDFLKDLNSIRNDYSDELARIGSGVVGLGMGLSIAIDNPSFDSLKAAGQVVGGALWSVNSIISLRNVWTKTKTKRIARRYLSDLSRIKRM